MKPLGVRILTAVLATIGLVACGAERDWTGVELAWRGDPRATADAPFEAEVAPTRRLSRRAQRRAASRRWVPIEAAPVETATVPGDGGVWSANAPTTISYDPALRGGAVPGGVIVHRDQPSLPTADARQRFDIFLPAGCAGGGMPLVVWIHGDSWRDGSRAECPVSWLAENGYAVASVGYRLSDTATFPAQLDDCRAALDEIRRTAEVWGVDPERIAVVGSGAGGHLAALAGLAGPEEPGVAAVCAVAAPAHLPSLGPEHQRPSSPASQFVGGPLAEFREVAQRASPLAHVSAGDPPCLLIHGDRDELIPAEQSVKLDAALRGAGVESRLVILPGTGHRTPLGRGSPAGQALVEFLDRTLGAGVRTSAATP